MESKIKECFISRFPEGYLVQADYSQLEVICLAILAKDKQLIEDLNNGLDMHCMSTSFLTGKDYADIYKYVKVDESVEWIKKRKLAKSVSFQAQYGAGVSAISKATGLSVDDVKRYLDNYYTRYTGVKEFQDFTIEQIAAGRKPSKKRTELGLPAGQSTIQLPTGRLLTFTEYDAPEWMRDTKPVSFSPTQAKNYPTQSFATGDIVPMMFGRLNRVLVKHFDGECLMVNTIHDSVIFDVVDKETLKEAVPLIKGVLESAPSVINEEFGLEFPLLLKVDIEAGKNWATLQPVNRVL